MFTPEGLRLIVSVSLCFMLFGSVLYYFNTRITALEKALVKQNQVLSDFIVNVKSNVMNQPNDLPSINGGASEEAIMNAKAIYSSSTPSNKIIVSEDDNIALLSSNQDKVDSDSDSDSDSN